MKKSKPECIRQMFKKMTWAGLSICLVCFIFASLFFKQIYFTIRMNDFEQLSSDSYDNITFNLPDFDKQVIYNIYSKNFFVGNRYEQLNIPGGGGYCGEIKQDKNYILCKNDKQQFALQAKNNKLFYIDFAGKKEIYNLKETYINRFFVFGMGLRSKFILFENTSGLYSLYDNQNKLCLYKNISISNIDAEFYHAEGIFEGQSFKIYENEEGIFIQNGDDLLTLDNSNHINIPQFSGKYAKELRMLFNEGMVNITTNGPIPNFITYEEPFYRDGAYIAMLCKETNNSSQIIPWIRTITEIYDLQRGENIKEPDNLGELLYMQSFLEMPNSNLISEIINEAYKRRSKRKTLTGIMDGEEHENYVTGWLKFGLESLGMNSDDWSIYSETSDSYTDLLWFYSCEELDEYKAQHHYYFSSLWPYLDYARGNFYNEDMSKYYEKNNESYMSYEPGSSGAKWKKIDENLSEVQSSTPHAWSAVEMYFYYLKYEP